MFFKCFFTYLGDIVVLKKLTKERSLTKASLHMRDIILAYMKDTTLYQVLTWLEDLVLIQVLSPLPQSSPSSHSGHIKPPSSR